MSDEIKTTEPEKPEKKYDANYGGHREGSGRKPIEKLPGKFNARELFYKKVDDRWDKIMEVMDTWVEDKDKEAVKWMVEQRIGKAPTSMNLEMSGSIAVEGLEKDIKNLLYDKGVGENSEAISNPVQDRGEQTNDPNGKPVRDIPDNSSA